MNERDRTSLLAMRAQIDALLGGSAEARESASPPRSGEWMRITQFARSHRYSRKTVAQWCRLGMPHIGRGHYTRINVREAEKWIADGGPSQAARRLGAEAYTKAVS